MDKLKYRKPVLFLIDLIIFVAIGFIVDAIDKKFVELIPSLFVLICIVMFVRLLFNTYKQVWRFATYSEYLFIVIADLIGGLAYMILRYFMTFPVYALWQAVSIVAVGCLATLAMRFIYQLIYRKNEAVIDNDPRIFVAIVGAGNSGYALVRELQVNKKSRFKACMFIDTDKEKIGSIINGLRVYSPDNAMSALKEMQVSDVIIAIPGGLGEKHQELYERYSKAGFRVKLYDYPFADANATSYNTSAKLVLRDFRIEDLLFREPVKINNASTGAFYHDRTIMITGGGGSIGSEICRQLAKFGPKKLVIFDIYENNAYDIQQELRVKYGNSLNVAVEISSVRDAVMAAYKPDIVIHAAAHKHVPLMEHNCPEAVKNNVFGTYNVASAAEKYGVKRFIMISTDKAVNPTNVMGATKRMCEMIVQSRVGSSTEFTAVRFGNVLGSNGSVIPLFRRQIANGGPVTITDQRITRYFMTIPEAAQLVLESGAMARNGELFVLDMGKPVKILKLAEDMIRLSGYEPYKEIDIKEIGLRQGEKLYEELLVKPDELDKTDNDKIFIERAAPLTREEVDAKLKVLHEAAATDDPEIVKAALKQVVPTYKDPEEVNVL